MAVPAALIAGGLTIAGQSMANSTNVALAREQMRFQERMSSTAYQRMRKDLEAAGLNPAMALGSGGASTPSGSQGRVENPLAPGVTSAQAAVQQRQERKRMEEEVRRMELERSVRQLTGPLEVQTMMQDIENLRSDQLLKIASAREVDARIRNLAADTLLKGLMVPGARNEARMQETLFGRVMPYVNSATGAAGALSRLRIPSFGPSGVKPIGRPSSRPMGRVHSDLPVGTPLRDAKTGKILDRVR